MKERFESPFDSDAEAREILDSDQMIGKWLANWTEYDGKFPAEIAIDGKFSLVELLAIIHFHPELARRRAAGITEPKSDEVRVLELSVQKLSEQLNELLQASTGTPIPVIQAPTRQAYMKARACLPAGYSMTLVKKKENS